MQARLLPALVRPDEIRSRLPRQLNWCDVVSYLVEQPVLLLFVLLALGTALGNIRVKGISIGPAAVLFVALGASAIDPELALPAMIGNVGLALFAYGVGVMAGPSFFSSLRTGAKPVALVASTLAAVGGLCWGLGALRVLTIAPAPRRLERLRDLALEAVDGRGSGLFWFLPQMAVDVTHPEHLLETIAFVGKAARADFRE